MFLPSCMSSSRPYLSRFGLGVGWKKFACRATFPSGCRAISPFGRRTTFEPNFLALSYFSEFFGRSRSDMHTFSFKDFSSLQSHNFWNTMSWKCSLKDDCIRLSLIEFQNLSESQDQCRPNIPRLDVFSMHCAGIVHSVVHSSQSRQDPCDFLSLASISKEFSVCLLLEF